MTAKLSAIHRLLSDLEDRIDRWRYTRRARNRDRDVVIVPYQGFGTESEVFLRGRVLEKKRIPPASQKDRRWRNLLAMYRRFESDEVPFARVEASAGGETIEFSADDEGYFEVQIDPNVCAMADHSWHDIELELVQPAPESGAPFRTVGRALIPHRQAAFGVISDIDDTILVTNAARRLRMLLTTLFGNARTRLPFPGVPSFYNALHRGKAGVVNPIFYLSSSPWNLYDFLTEFMAIHELPAGPLLLRDMGIDRSKLLKATHASHKLRRIKQLMHVYPALPFILIGDSGQHDPEIYSQAAHAFPGRIPAIYIRDVSGRGRHGEVASLARTVRDQGGEMVLVRDSFAAADHAASRGFIELPRSV